MSYRKLIAALVAGLVLLTACTSGHRKGASSSGFVDPVSTDSNGDVDLPIFYDVPDPLPPGQPGDVIKTETVLTNSLGRMLRVMYHSRSVQGADIAVTGIVAFPATSPPPGGYPIVAWDHATVGLADRCAPSLAPNNVAAIAAGVVSTGKILTATDYEGLGTPGRHPYLVGESEARSTIDLVRAARSLADTHASNRYVVWGGSQGAHAAVYTLEQAPIWGPELQLLGVVATAPVADLKEIDGFLRGGSLKGVLLMIAAGFNAAYGDAMAPLSADLTSAGTEQLGNLDRFCNKDVESRVGKLDLSTLESTDPITSPAWAKVLSDNDPLDIQTAQPVPLLLVHGGSDEVVPVDTSAHLYDHLCSLGQATQRWVYPGQSHDGVLGVSSKDTLGWIQDRFDGTAVTAGVRPLGQKGVETQRCP